MNRTATVTWPEKTDLGYWGLSYASLLSPFLFFSAILVYQKQAHPEALQAATAGRTAQAFPGYGSLMQMLLAVGLGCSLGIALNIVKMKRYEKKGLLEYLPFVLNGLVLAATVFSLMKIQG